MKHIGLILVVLGGVGGIIFYYLKDLRDLPSEDIKIKMFGRWSRRFSKFSIISSIALCTLLVLIGSYLQNDSVPFGPVIEVVSGPNGESVPKASSSSLDAELTESSGEEIEKAKHYSYLGEQALKNQKYRSAILNFKNAVILIPTASGYFNLSVSYYLTSYYDSADAAVIQGIEYATKNNRKHILGGLLSVRATLVAERGHYDSTEEYLNRATLIAVEVKDSVLMLALKMNYGNLYSKTGRLMEAKKVYSELISSYRLLNDARGASGAALNLGIILGEEGKFKEARSVFATVVDFSTKADDKLIVLMGKYNLALTYSFEGDNYSTTLNKFNECLSLAEDIGNPMLIVSIKNYIADALMHVGYPDSAMVISQSNLIQARQNNHTTQMVEALTTICPILIDKIRNEPNVSMRDSLSRVLNDHLWEIDSLCPKMGMDDCMIAKLGVLDYKYKYEPKGEDRRLKVLQELALLLQKRAFGGRLAATYYEIGQVYRSKNQLNMVRSYYEKALSIYLKMGVSNKNHTEMKEFLSH